MEHRIGEASSVVGARLTQLEQTVCLFLQARLERCLQLELEPGTSLGLDLIAQYITDRQEQVTSEIIGGFATRIFDPVVTSVVSELPVLKFPIAVLNNFRTNLSAEKIVQCPSLLCVAEKYDDRAVVFH